MAASILVLAVLSGALFFMVATLGPVLRDLADTLRATVTGGRLSEGPWSNLAMAALWLLLFLIGVL